MIVQQRLITLPRPKFTLPAVRSLTRNWLLFIPVAFVLVGIVLPLGVVFSMSFRAGNPFNLGAFTFRNYTDTFTAAITYQAFLNTLLYVGISVTIAVTVSLTLAWLVERTDMPFKNVAWVLMLLPLGMPSFLTTLAWMLLLNPTSGVLNVMARTVLASVGVQLTRGPVEIFSLAGMIFVNVITGGTTIFLFLVSGFRMMNSEMEEAGHMAGARAPTVFRKIFLRVMTPVIAVAIVYKLASDFNDIDIPLLLGIQNRTFVLPTLVFFSAFFTSPSNWGMATAISSPLIVIAIALTFVYYRVVVRQSQLQRFATVSGKGGRRRRIQLGKWRYPAFGLFLTWFTLGTAAPLVMLLWASLLPAYRRPSWEAFSQISLDNYASLLSKSSFLSTVMNSVALAVITATISVVIAFAISWSVLRTKVRGRGVLDGIVFVPHVLPGPVIAVGLVFAFLNFLSWIPIYGSVWIMALALLVGYMPFLTRMYNSALGFVHQEMEEAAQMSGARRFATWRWVTGPLIMPALVTGWVWVAVNSSRSLNVPLMLSSTGNETVGVLLFKLIDRDADFSGAATLGMLLLIATSGLLMLTRKFIRNSFSGETS
jgi:iron(III) transport system permease protein